MAPASAERTVGQRLQRDIVVLYAAALAHLALELVVVARMGALTPLGAIAYGTFGAVVLGWVCLLVGATSGALGSIGRALALQTIAHDQRREQVSAVVIGLLVGTIAVAIIRPWELRSDPAHFAFSVPITSVCAALAMGLAFARIRPRYVATAVLLGSACVFVINSLWYRGLYLSLHRAAVWLTWIAMAFALGVVWTRAARRPSVVFGPMALFAAAHLGLPLAQQAHEVSVIYGIMVPTASAVLRSLDDADGDGYSARFGGGDCDDADPAVRPGQCEILGNGRDDNCNGLTDPHFPTTARSKSAARIPRSPLPDIYLVIVDTLRADFGGPGRAKGSPTLEALAGQSLDFERGYTPYPATFHSLSAMIQSRSPRTYDPSHMDLATLLVAHGYDAQLWLGDERRVIGVPSAVWPLRGKQHFSVDSTHPSYGHFSARIFDEAIAELAKEGVRPRFRWLHLLDLHTPWVHAPGRGNLRERYLAELAHVESLLVRLFAALEAHERGRSAVIIVIGDHGEQLGEHGASFHDAFVWEQSIKVPMIMRLPGVAPRAIDAPASLIDVAPTLLSALGLPEPTTFQGHDWLSAPERRASPPIAEVGESGAGRWGPPARQAVIGDRYKLSLNVSEMLYELYDLASDPGESTLLPRSSVPEAAELLEHLRRHQDQPGCRPSP